VSQQAGRVAPANLEGLAASGRQRYLHIHASLCFVSLSENIDLEIRQRVANYEMSRTRRAIPRYFIELPRIVWNELLLPGGVVVGWATSEAVPCF
jgi:hypothetical protein